MSYTQAIMHGELISEASGPVLDLDGAAEMSPYWCYSAGDIKESEIQRLPFVSDPLPLCAWGGHWSSEFIFYSSDGSVLLSARDSEPASVAALNISNRGLASSVSLKWKSKYRVVFLSSFLLFEDIIKISAILCVHMYVIEGIFNTPGLKLSFRPEALIIDLHTLQPSLKRLG